MLFLQALEQMKDGVAMRRSAWTAADGYLKVLPDMSYVWKIITQPNPNAGNYIFSIEDFESNDWVVFFKDHEVLDLSAENVVEVAV
jgi:carbamoylphosphate synthase small subunit